MRRATYQFGEDGGVVDDVDFWYFEFLEVAGAKNDICMGVVQNMARIGRGFLGGKSCRSGHTWRA
jgi:hypothetical protein